MKLGLFGGTFDPIHFGHLNLAIELSEKHSLDEVLFCPVFQSPFKKKEPIAAPEQRAEMLSLAIEGIPSFRLLDLEIKRKGISFTIDTLRALHYPSSQLFLLLSEDSLLTFHLWKNAPELIHLAQPLIGSRHPFSQKIPKTPLSSALLKGLTATRGMEISSSDLRVRLASHLYCGHLIPTPVLTYIHEKKLYLTQKAL